MSSISKSARVLANHSPVATDRVVSCQFKFALSPFA